MKTGVLVTTLTTLIFSCFSCTILSPRIDKDIDVSKLGKYQECTPSPVSMTYTHMVKGVTTQRREADPDEKGVEWYSYYLRNYLRNNSKFNITSLDNDPRTIFLNFDYTSNPTGNLAERIWFTATLATLGILPSYTHSNEVLSVVVLNSKGEELGKYSSNKIRYELINGIIFSPLGLIYQDTSFELQKKYIYEMADSIILQLIEDKIICRENK